MPNHFVFNFGNHHWKNRSNSFLDIKISTIELHIRRNVSIQAGDKFIALQNEELDAVFTHFGSVEKIEKIKDDSIQELAFVFKIELRSEGKLQINNQLADFAYSLKRITNYLSPEKHFNRSYSNIDEFDFETIREGRIYIARTAFGRLINSMELTHRINFIRHYVSDDPEAFLVKDKNYIEAYNRLSNYIKIIIIQPARQLREAFSLFKEIVNYDQITEQTTFQKESENTLKVKADTISNQVEIVETFLNKHDTQNTLVSQEVDSKIEPNFLDYLETQVSSLESDQIFSNSKKFRELDWPIILS
ncbi:MAG: hypothetical protein AAFY45_18720 [Bacteroidota bacterium]